MIKSNNSPIRIIKKISIHWNESTVDILKEVDLSIIEGEMVA